MKISRNKVARDGNFILIKYIHTACINKKEDSYESKKRDVKGKIS